MSAAPLLSPNQERRVSFAQPEALGEHWEIPETVKVSGLRDLKMDSKVSRDVQMQEVRQNYVRQLRQYRLVTGSYIPNLVPILRWNAMAASNSPSPMHSPAFASPGALLHRTLFGDGKPDSGQTSGQNGQECSQNERTGVFRSGSITSSLVNLSAAALGAGALSLPRAMYYAGVIVGPIFMIILACLSKLSVKVIVDLVDVSGKGTYEEIAKLALGPWFAVLVELNIILFCFGTAVAYMITVGQISQQILGATLGDFPPDSALGMLFQQETMLLIVTVVILLPLSILDSINDLRFASLFGVCCILYLIVVVVYIFLTRAWINPSLFHEETGAFQGMAPKDGLSGCFKMLSLAIFAFCCQPNVPAIYTELERKSSSRMSMVTSRSMTLCVFVYLLMGITGFLAFGEATEGNVLINLQDYLCDGDYFVVAGFACMAFAVTMAFPLNIFPIRFAVETTLFYKFPSLNCQPVRFTIALLTVGAALCVAIVVPEINLVFELIGATTGSFVCFIGPGIMLIRLKRGAASKWLGRLLVTIGVVFLVLGTYSSVKDILESFASGEDPAEKEPTCPKK